LQRFQSVTVKSKLATRVNLMAGFLAAGAFNRRDSMPLWQQCNMTSSHFHLARPSVRPGLARHGTYAQGSDLTLDCFRSRQHVTGDVVSTTREAATHQTSQCSSFYK